MSVISNAIEFSQLPAVFSNNSINDIGLKEERLYKCEVCNKSYNSKVYLRDHLTIHSDVKAYECNVCRKRFRFGSNLSEHKSLHIKNNLFFKCTICDHAARLRGNLKKHMKKHFRDEYALDEVWRKLRDSGTLDVNREIRRAVEKGIRRKRNYNLNYISFEEEYLKPPPLLNKLNQTYTFGEKMERKPIICPPPLVKLDMSSNSIYQYMSGTKIFDENIDSNPPVLMSIAEEQRRLQMKKLGKDITEAKILKFKKLIEETAAIAISTEAFFARLDNIPFDEIMCSMCNLNFSCISECEEHIFMSHDKPYDQNGNSFFCDICLKVFESAEKLINHQNYHNMIREMLETNTLDIESDLEKFKNEMTQKLMLF